jgi:hypothetical protein
MRSRSTERRAIQQIRESYIGGETVNKTVDSLLDYVRLSEAKQLLEEWDQELIEDATPPTRKPRIREGGHRVHIPPDVKEAFVRAICNIVDPVKRKEEFDSVMEEIKERNTKAYMKSHPEANVTENTAPPLGSPGSDTI